MTNQPDQPKTRRTELEESLQEVIAIAEEAIRILNDSEQHTKEASLLNERLQTVKAVATNDPQPDANSGGLYESGSQPKG